MINFELGIIFFGLAAALSWGVGDFSGGLASKRSSVFSVVILSQFIGGIGMLLLAFLSGEALPPARDLIFGAAAGLAGAVGILQFYHGLAVGRMGFVAPMTAVTTAAIPILFSLILVGWPSLLQIVGFACALVAVWLISANGDGSRIRPGDLVSPFIAGLGFGLFFILIDQVSPAALYWPLVAARIASVTFLTAGVVFTKRKGLAVARDQLPIILLVGILDVAGNVFFLLATKSGRLDIAAVLASLYPAATVLMARLFLKEQITWRQGVGIGAAIGAVILLAL